MNSNEARPWPAPGRARRLFAAVGGVLVPALAMGGSEAPPAPPSAPLPRLVSELLTLDAERALEHERRARLPALPPPASDSGREPPPASSPRPVLTAIYGATARVGLYAEVRSAQGHWLFRQGRRQAVSRPSDTPVSYELDGIQPPCVRLTAAALDRAEPHPPLQLCLERPHP